MSSDSDKQVAHGWGGAKGDDEWNDEKAGDAIAHAEEKAEGWDAAVDAPVDAEGHHLTEAAPAAAAEPEPEPESEDNTMSYADYLAQQAQKKLDLGKLDVRKPNENAKQDKKWAQAKALVKEEEDAYMAGAGGKAKREKQRKEKAVLDIDQRYVEPPRGGYEGGRGGRGGRGRGEGRGDFRGGDRGRGGGRGRGEGYRGEYRGRGGRGGGGGGGGAVNVSDTNAFPSLGK